MTRVKICGITNLEDALAACDAGTDAVGFIFAASPRRVEPSVAASIRSALPPLVTAVGVFVNERIDEVRSLARQCRLSAVQLHGDEDREYVRHLGWPVVKSFRVRDESVLTTIEAWGCRTFLLDTYVPGAPGGTGKTLAWELAARAKKFGNVILAGGLTADNVTKAIKVAHPYAVDVSSGVEREPGRKDHKKMRRFINEVRSWDYRTDADTLANSADDLFLRP